MNNPNNKFILNANISAVVTTRIPPIAAIINSKLSTILSFFSSSIFSSFYPLPAVTKIIMDWSLYEPFTH